MIVKIMFLYTICHNSETCIYLSVRPSVHLSFTALQVGRTRVRFPMLSLRFFIDLILLAALWPWVRLKPLTEMSTRDISLGVKAVGA
jgi:hypothetical protein